MKDLRLRKTILASLLVAMGIVLTSVVSITYPPNNAIIRFGIGYLPLIIISIMLGPRIGFMSAIVQDIGAYFFYMMVFGVASGPFFPGFTINAILFGVVPGLIYRAVLRDKKIFNYINIILLVGLLGLGIYALIDMENIIASIHGNSDFSPVVLYVILGIGLLGLIPILYFVLKRRNEDDSSHRIIFSIILLFLVTNLVLTPLWVSYLYGIPYLPQIPLRIVKTPFEIFIYSILLIRIVKVLNIYMLKEQN